MTYSEALEQQLALLRLIESRGGGPMPEGHDWEFDSERRLLPSLRMAEPFWWSAEMCGLLAGTARTFPSHSRLDVSALPCIAGFFWFALPLEALRVPVAGTDGWEGPITALVWWLCRDPSDDHHFVELVVVRRTKGHWAGIPSLSGDWAEGESLRDAAATYDNTAAATESLRYLAAAWGLLSQRILVSPSRGLERHAAKRVARTDWGHVPAVRVVELRRKERLGEKQPVEAVEREWTCQWVVRGHWRQQFYPSKHSTQPIWITPYVKGPEDKPLKPPRATVFAVIR